MRGSWLGRIFAGDDEAGESRLRQAVEAGDWPAVLQDARRALRRRPGDVELLCLLARARLEAAADSDPEADSEAAGWLEQALAAEPEHRDARYYRGLVAWRRGEQEQAVEQWRRVLAVEPDDEPARTALVKVWSDQGELPDWGVGLVETALLDQRG